MARKLLPSLKMPEPIKEPVEKPTQLNGSIRIDLGDDITIEVDPSKITVSLVLAIN